MNQPKKVILVIDDDRTMNEIVGAILREAEYNVYTATSFQSGLDRVKSVRPDLVILDLHLGGDGDDGGDLLAKIKAMPRMAETPVLMLSGETKLAEIKRVMHGGADHYLLKPFAPEELLSRVARFMGQKTT